LSFVYHFTSSDTNQPPIANAGPDSSVDEDTTGFFLNGTASSDDGGSITDYFWTQTEGPEVELDTTTNPGHALFDVRSAKIPNLLFSSESKIMKGQRDLTA